MKRVISLIVIVVFFIKFTNVFINYDEVVDYESIKYIQGDSKNNPYDRSKSILSISCNSNIGANCFGETETSNNLTNLLTTVTFDPNSKTSLHVKNEITWDGSPAFSIKDFSIIGYDHSRLKPDITTIKATTKVYFYYEKINKW